MNVTLITGACINTGVAIVEKFASEGKNVVFTGRNIEKVAEAEKNYREKYPNVKIHVYEIENRFFGEHITVAGLLTGQDLKEQLIGKPLGDTLYISSNTLRHDGDLFLCGMHIDELSEALGVEIVPCLSDGYEFFDKLCGF